MESDASVSAYWKPPPTPWLRATYRPATSGEGFRGIQLYGGLILIGVTADCYHGFIGGPPWVLLYWRLSVWLFGFQIIRWRR